MLASSIVSFESPAYQIFYPFGYRGMQSEEGKLLAGSENKARKAIKFASKKTYRCWDDANTSLNAITKRKKKSYWNITGSIRVSGKPLFTRREGHRKMEKER